jgi:hypothetical protein
MYSGKCIDQLFEAVTRAEEHAELEMIMQLELRRSIDEAIGLSARNLEPIAIQPISVA